jgi:hypothetical protein
MSPRIKPSANASVPSTRLSRLRPRVWAGLICLLGLGYGAQVLWHRAAPSIAHHPQYVLSADRIHITAPPPWIRSDIKAEVLRDTLPAETLSVLDDWQEFSRRIKDAFEFHPWVASVERISKKLPASLDIELKYRRPIAAVESSDAAGVSFLPVDEHAVRLPEDDLTEVERRYLPRVSGVTGRPLVGDVWDDPRVAGGAKLAAALADVWQQLRLVEIISELQPQPVGHEPICTYEIVTSGGTRILWGTAPGSEAPAGESPLDKKRARLLEYASQHGQLETIDGPAMLDVRSDLIVTPRTARRESTDAADETR